MENIEKKSRERALPLAAGLDKRLGAYALAAGAAGVSVLALAPPAQASIISGTGTPINIGVNTTEFLTINGSHELSF